MKLALSIMLLAISPVTILHSQKTDKSLVQRIVGEWEGGARHIRALYADAAFTLDPQPGTQPLGTWKIVGDKLITQFRDEPTARTDRIIKLTDSAMVIEFHGVKYTYKQVTHR